MSVDAITALICIPCGVLGMAVLGFLGWEVSDRRVAAVDREKTP